MPGHRAHRWSAPAARDEDSSLGEDHPVEGAFLEHSRPVEAGMAVIDATAGGSAGTEPSTKEDGSR